MNFKPLLAVNHLQIAFSHHADRSDHWPVNGVTFSIDPGEILVIAGESGSGKSLTLLAMGRLLPSNAVISGEICWKGENLLTWTSRRLQPWRGREMAYVFQDPMGCFNPLMSVGRQILEMVDSKKWRRAERISRVLEWLSRVGFSDPERIYRAFPWELSGGMQQRAMIAMATINVPQLLLADEPTTALDSQSQRDILRLLLELRRQLGLAILLVTHDLPMARRIADRILIMHSGVIVEENNPEALFLNPQHPYTRQLLASIPHFPYELSPATD